MLHLASLSCNIVCHPQFEDSSKPPKETKIAVKLLLFYHLKNSDDHSVN